MTDYEKILHTIKHHPKYFQGINYGKPRKGHQEGTVEAHLQELETNLDRMIDHLTVEEIWKLRILIHTHDTFKKWATRDSPIDDFNSHSSLARTFLSELTDVATGYQYKIDEDLLAMVQWHDENFALWKQFKRKGEYDVERFHSRVLAIRDIELFLFFTIIDGYTASKMALADEEKPEKLRWFTDQVALYRQVPRVYKMLEVFGL